jgi:hypothetical protein
LLDEAAVLLADLLAKMQLKGGGHSIHTLTSKNVSKEHCIKTIQECLRSKCENMG